MIVLLDRRLLVLSIYKRFHAGYSPEPNSGCWLWEKSCDKNGYGYIKYKDKTTKAHRVSLLLIDIDIENKMVLHKCDNPSCVNPTHLFVGNAKDNMQDMLSKNRQNYTGTSLPRTKNPNAKLTEKDVQEIRSSIQSLKELSLLYGISITHVHRIKRYKSWK